MSHADPDFEARLDSVLKRHRALARGAGYRIMPDGLIVAHPRRRLPRFPLAAVLCVLLGGVVFKATLVALLGATVHAERVEALARGNVVERGVALVMQADPVTERLAMAIRGAMP